MKSERRKAFVAVYEKNINSGQKSAYRNIMDPCDAMCYYCQEKGKYMYLKQLPSLFDSQYI